VTSSTANLIRTDYVTHFILLIIQLCSYCCREELTTFAVILVWAIAREMALGTHCPISLPLKSLNIHLVTLTTSILPQQLGGGIYKFSNETSKKYPFLYIFIITDNTKMKENRFGGKTSRIDL
jgi:hypothetical protein